MQSVEDWDHISSFSSFDAHCLKKKDQSSSFSSFYSLPLSSVIYEIKVAAAIKLIQRFI